MGILHPFSRETITKATRIKDVIWNQALVSYGQRKLILITKYNVMSK